MEFKNSLPLKISLIILGIIFSILGLYETVKTFSSIIESLLQITLNITAQGSITLSIIYFSISYILFVAGFYQKEPLKQYARGLVSAAIFFISLTFLLMSVQNNSEDLTNSIQPSIDLTIASLIDNIIETNIQIKNGTKINLTLSENTIEEKYYVSNLTINQANLFIEKLEITNSTTEKNLQISKLFITLGYEKIIEETLTTPDIAIPINEIKNQAQSMGVDLNILSSIEPTTLNQIMPLNQKAYLTFLISENTEIKEITIGSLTNENIEQIWENLGFNSGISIESKNTIINILLSLMIEELNKTQYQGFELSSLPISSLKSMFPEDITKALSFDILNPDYNYRASEINELRYVCETKEINLSDICDAIQLTKYDYLMPNMKNLSMEAGIEIPEIYLNKLETVNTIEKLEQELITFTQYHEVMKYLSIFLLALSCLTYLLHIRYNDYISGKLEVFYKISKLNIQHFGLSYIFLIIGVIIITNKYFFDFAQTFIPESSKEITNILPTLPIFSQFITILTDIIIYSTIYFVISLIIFISLRYKIKTIK